MVGAIRLIPVSGIDATKELLALDISAHLRNEERLGSRDELAKGVAPDVERKREVVFSPEA